MAEPGDPASAAAKRAADLGLQFQARGFPVEFFALGGIGPGIPIRAKAFLSSVAQTRAPGRSSPHPQAAAHKQAAPRQPPAAEHKEAAGALSGGVAAVSSFLQSREGKKAAEASSARCVGMLKKRL